MTETKVLNPKQRFIVPPLSWSSGLPQSSSRIESRSHHRPAHRDRRPTMRPSPDRHADRDANRGTAARVPLVPMRSIERPRLHRECLAAETMPEGLTEIKPPSPCRATLPSPRSKTRNAIASCSLANSEFAELPTSKRGVLLWTLKMMRLPSGAASDTEETWLA